LHWRVIIPKPEQQGVHKRVISMFSLAGVDHFLDGFCLPSRWATFVVSFVLIQTFAVTTRGDDVYVAGTQKNGTQRNGIITKYDAAGVATVFASGLESGSALAFDTAGNLYVTNLSFTELNQDSIVKFTSDGTRAVFAAGLNGPRDLAFDGAGNLYVAEQYNNRVLKFTSAGAVSVFANVSQPKGLAFDANGNLYLASQNGTIMKFVSDGTGTVFADQIQNAGVQVYPSGIAFDKAGNLDAACYNSGTNNADAIMKFTPDGNGSAYVTQSMINPYHLAFDSDGNLYVSNFGQFDSTGKPVNSSIIKVASNGVVSTFAGPLTVNPEGIAIWPGLLPVKPAAPPTAGLLNISTRMRVLTGDNVLIGGFIITGSDPKKVIILGIGPSLNGVGVTLSDPTLELHQGSTTLASNNNWKINDQSQQSQEADIRATMLAPTNDLESAIVMTLNPGAYTAILADKNGGTGVGIVEVFDLGQGANSHLANISTRGFVDKGDNVMIGGLIVGGGSGGSMAKVIVRARGPSLPVPDRLSDPTLELHNGNGVTIVTNDNWKINDQTGQSQEAEIRAAITPLTNDLESAILINLTAGNYTAIVAGKDNGTGVGLIEAYNLQ
jgi:hypothetical protein